MKLKSLREHYVTKDKGNTWIPKIAFDTLEEVLLYLEKTNRKMTYYICDVCMKYHVATDWD